MIKKWLISDLIPRFIFQKFHEQKISKSRVLDQFWRLEIMVMKLFRSSKFSYFLGIKSEINQQAAYQWITVW